MSTSVCGAHFVPTLSKTPVIELTQRTILEGKTFFLNFDNYFILYSLRLDGRSFSCSADAIVQRRVRVREDMK